LAWGAVAVPTKLDQGFDPDLPHRPSWIRLAELRKQTVGSCTNLVLRHVNPSQLIRVRNAAASAPARYLEPKRRAAVLGLRRKIQERLVVMIGKRVQFYDETWHELQILASESMKSFQELADEAFNDLLAKHGRPTSLKDALRKSAGNNAKVIPLRRRGRASKKRK
jgi:hypothetical protein